jgi:hypothetical protein
VLFEEAVGVSYLTSTYFQLLPYAPSAASAPPAPDGNLVSYRPAKCTTCTNGFNQSYEDAQAFLEQSRALLEPKTIAFLVSMFLVSVAALVAIYFALDSALGGNGQFFMSGPVSIAGWLAGPPQ